MEPYDHKAIESKWQKRWAEASLYKTNASTDKPKQYILDMFPYPSGEGLHVGHPKGYIATDIYSRYKKMNGFEVLHPMGWDAFGLPAENFAIKHKVHPRVAVEKNIANFKNQLALLGFNYDWTREINTTDPAFYKWTQWIFLKLFEKGLAHQSFEPINWCPSCQTGLANEDVNADGTCERCDSTVTKKPMRQWVLKITEYADRMLQDLDSLTEWPEHIKEAQRNWIGKKEGIIVSHPVVDQDFAIETFSAYPAWMYADTYVVLAPEHPLVPKLVQGLETEQEVLQFVSLMASKTMLERTEGKEKLGVFTGCYVEDPYREGARMPVWVANFALMNFGTGAIRCSGHDERDVAFAEKYNIPLRTVVGDGTFVNAHLNEGTLKDSGPFTGKTISPTLIAEMVEWMVKMGIAKRKTSYKIQDWVFSRQRYWGEPIPVIHCKKCGVVPVPEKDLPVLLPDVDHYEPTGTGESPLAAIESWVNVPCPSCGGDAKRETNTMPQWAGSSWYWLRFMDPHNASELVNQNIEKKWGPVDVYVGGDHAVRHLIYARFWHKFLYDINLVSTLEPFTRLEFLGFVLAEDGRKMSKRWGNIINPDDIVHSVGADSMRVYEMFMGPFENTVPWSTNGLVGSRRFIERVLRLRDSVRSEDVAALETILHQTVQKVSEDIEKFKFNTAVSALMIFVNEVEKQKTIGKKQYDTLLILIAPFAPHVTEELWERIGNHFSIHQEMWPIFDPAKATSDKVEIAVQVGGKTKGSIRISRDLEEGEVFIRIKNDQKLSKYVDFKPKKVIYVKNKIINFIP
ncbi:MAG: leucine--tRNA ligase [Patescibacteria group bacterium]